MAGDWIKMRLDLAEDPAVVAISAKLGIDEFAVVGRLHRVWSWFSAQSRFGHAKGVTRLWLDRHAARDGFCEAMESVGWLKVSDDGISMPGFDKHNSNSAKERALVSRRKQAERARRNGRDPVTKVSRSNRDITVTREEKRREESNTPLKPPQGGAAISKRQQGSKRQRTLTPDEAAAAAVAGLPGGTP